MSCSVVLQGRLLCPDPSIVSDKQYLTLVLYCYTDGGEGIQLPEVKAWSFTEAGDCYRNQSGSWFQQGTGERYL